MQWDQFTARIEKFTDTSYDYTEARVCVVAELPGGGVRVRPLASSVTADFAADQVAKRDKVEERIVGRASAEGDDVVVEVKDPADFEGAKRVYLPKAAVVEHLEPLVHSKLGFLIIVNLLLLVVGSVMDIYSGIVVIAPLIVPMAVAYHVNLVHLGIIFVLNLELGLAHPPLGINLFIAQSYFRKSILEVTVAAIPFLLLLLGVLGAVTYWEPLSLWFVQHAPKAAGGG
jgi:hypothetical protein